MASLFGDLLFIARRRLGLSQREAALLLKITQAHLSRLEAGRSLPRDALRQRLQTVYRIDPLAIEAALAGRTPPRCRHVLVAVTLLGLVRLVAVSLGGMPCS